MKKVISRIIFLLWIVLFVNFQVMSQTLDRSEVSDIYKWDLSDLFLSDNAWTETKNKVFLEMDKILSFKGTLAESASNLVAYLEFSSNIYKELLRMNGCYGSNDG